MLLMHELTRPDVSLELLIVRHHETTLKYSWHFMTVMSYTIYKLELYILIIIIFFLKMVTSTQNWPRINSFTKVCGQKWDVMSQRGIKKKKRKEEKRNKSASEEMLKTPLPLSSGGSASCARSNANTEPDFQTSRSLGPGNRWMGRGSTTWWWWCWRKKRRTVNH